jgi:putative ABC transport system permease protein
MLELRNINKNYSVDGKPFPALKNISLAFADSGFTAILGPSGCGKTTLLNIIGGLDHYTSGDLIIDGKSTKDFKDSEWDAYRNERVGFVFQTYNLIPHMNVINNVEVSLMLNGVSRAERIKRAYEALSKVGLADVAKKKPNQLSGGQMQRVAIARALVNNPRIILADEPTGALDSVTSVQVMELLKESSKDHCVIMVTHNQELANRYAKRIITMKDGIIITDSAPLPVGQKAVLGKEINKKTSMSFMTAFKSSLQNIQTKKTRTILTAVASSFGIIGVALVLALSNGFTSYVDNVEGSVASAVPISVTPTVYDYTTNAVDSGFSEYTTDDDVYVYDTSSSSYVAHRNNYNQTYFDYIDKLVDKGWARSVMYNRINLSFNLLTKDGDTDTIKQVSQYSSAGLSGSILSSVASLPATVFHELYGEEQGLSSMYDVIYGKFPTAANEVVLITDRYNRVELSTLKSLGIVSSSSTVTNGTPVSFSSIVYDGEGDTDYKGYKAYLNSDWYQVADAAGNSTVKTEAVTNWDVNISSVTDDSKTYLQASTNTQYRGTKTIHYFERPSDVAQIYDDDATYNPIDLKIVGVLRPSQSSYINLMPSSIGYLASLKDEFTTDVAEGGKGYELAKYSSDDYYIGDDGISALNTALAQIDTSDASSATISQSTLQSLFSSVYTFRYIYAYTGTSPGTMSYSSYLVNCRNVGGDFREGEVTLPATPSSSDDSSVWSDYIQYWVEKLMYPGFYNGTYDDDNTWAAVDFMAYYSSYSLVSSVLIFPASLTTKASLLAYLNAYNDGLEDSETIVYTDIMGTFTDSLGIMINVISAVLIVFASISLVVSSVMTGIITYISVIERTKEIGILRACGARKKDVSRLFEAECVIIGFAAGMIGIIVTLVACVPVNYIIDHLYPGNNLSSIAQLNPLHAVILVVLAVVLALVSGFIPARMAAKKDPVTALRTE